MVTVSLMPTPARAALYLRVSTDQQTTDNQRPDLVALARQRGFSIEAVYDDTASAIKQRLEFDRMLLDAHRGKFNLLLVWSLDRLGRETFRASPRNRSSPARKWFGQRRGRS